MDGESLDIKQARLQKLKKLFPEFFVESQLDWEKLKAAFGDDINFANERYVLNWAGKSDAFRILQQPTTATLKPAPEESINFNNTENLFIEGENLEVLKVLQKAYYGKVKCIIIDPPYNTGSDSFIYPDRFSEKKEDYLKRIGDKDEEGLLMKEGLFRKNSKDSGHYHSNWLSMMYPRLFLAKNLLRDDGVIFVHIDDNEVHNLRMVMNEIFGEENFICQVINRSNPRGSQASKYFAMEHEYILVYCKNNFEFELGGYEKTDEEKEEYNLVDENGKNYRLLGLRQRGGAWKREHRPKMFYPIYINPENGSVSLQKSGIFNLEVTPKRPTGEESRWTWSKELLEKNSHFIVGKKINRSNTEVEVWDIFRKDYLEKENGITLKKPRSIWDEKGVNNQNGRAMVKELFDGVDLFDFPKSTFLPKKIINSLNDDDFIILDFFAGSGTTAQAVLEQNKEDGGNRKFILVQLPEQCDENSEAFKAGYKTIADIAKERIRRVIWRITSPPAPLLKERGEEVSYAQELFKGAGTALFGNARSMRKEKTKAEDKLWRELRNKQIENCKFRRQHPIGNFIADFYCHEKKLLIEVDGGYHDEKEQQAYDVARTQIINEFGIKVIRFSNEEVLNESQEVLKKITEALQLLSPSPSGEGAGGEVGFKVFKLSTSNFKIWRGAEIDSEEKLAQQMDAFTNPVRPGAEKQNMLYELMLKAGFDLTSKLQHVVVASNTKKSHKSKKIDKGSINPHIDSIGYYSINNNELIIALDAMNEKLVEQIIASKPQKVITLDSLFTGNDQLKTNTVLQMRDAGVDFKTI